MSGTITIDKKLLREYLAFTDFCSALPMSLPNYYPTYFTWTYDGEWIAITTILAGYYPSARSTVAYESGGTYKRTGTSTGTGAEQTIEHGLGYVPTTVMLSELTTGGALAYQSTTATNEHLYITATNAKTYRWVAEYDSTTYLQACVNIKAPTDATLIYYFFFEPQKAEYDNYQGFDTRDGADYNARSRRLNYVGGVKTCEDVTILAGQDWTVERKMMLSHQKDKTDMYFYIDGTEVAHHTTYVSGQPYEICCAEPNGAIRTVYFKYPKGMYVDKV